MVVIMGDFLSINAYAGRNNVYMCAINIRMLENNIRLVPVAHTLHILLSHFGKLLIADLIQRIWVQRNMAYRFYRFDICRQIWLKALINIGYGIRAVHSVGYLVQEQNCSVFIVHFLLIVQNCTIHIASLSNFRNHFSTLFSDTSLQIPVSNG